MISAIYHGGAGPWWMGVLVAAKEWGATPWDIAGGSRLQWYTRWVEYENTITKARQVKNGKK